MTTTSEQNGSKRVSKFEIFYRNIMCFPFIIFNFGTLMSFLSSIPFVEWKIAEKKEVDATLIFLHPPQNFVVLSFPPNTMKIKNNQSC